MLRRKMSLALLLVGAVVLGSVGSCSRIILCAIGGGMACGHEKHYRLLAASDFQCPLGWDNVQREWHEHRCTGLYRQKWSPW